MAERLRFAGGAAVQISGMAKTRTRWIFTYRSINGADEIYVVPLEGGAARQLTSDGNGIGAIMWAAEISP